MNHTRSVRAASCGRGLTPTVALCYHRDMSQPVKLSSELVVEARLAGEVLQRSIAGQVEFWARLGQAVEPFLQGRQVRALSQNAPASSPSACLESVDSPEGRQRVADFLRSQPHPHYEPAPRARGMLVRIEANGRRTVGRFVNRQFQPAKVKRPKT